MTLQSPFSLSYFWIFWELLLGSPDCQRKFVFVLYCGEILDTQSKMALDALINLRPVASLCGYLN